MLCTVGEAAKILNISPSAIRYYDKEGLLPFVGRSEGGIRVFNENDFNWLFIIECLKKSGLSIKDIKKYIDMTLEGDETTGERLELFKNQRERVIEQIEALKQTLDILDYKCWYYETAKTAGTTSVMQNITAEDIPKELRGAAERLGKGHSVNN